MNKQETKKLEEKIRNILSKHLKKKDKIVVGVSGGPDSIFLLKFLAELPNKILVAHINHLLRKESGKDEKFVKDFVEKLNNNTIREQKNSPAIIFHSTKKNIKKLAKKHKTGIEETGRHIRYDFFEKLAKKYNATLIATAHHADDNLETILLNLTRGATLQGLIGMQIKENKLFRPLLTITKKQITDYLKLRKIPFITEKSNLTDEYNRNLIRNRALPHLKKINPNIAQTTAKNTQNLREIQDYITKQAQKWLKRNKTTIASATIPAKQFRLLHPALQKTILREIHKNLTNNTKNLENTHIEEVLHLINQNIGNKQKKLGKLHLSLKKNTIFIKKS
jgi:tRNA(Ile)-lysidine synthase